MIREGGLNGTCKIEYINKSQKRFNLDDFVDGIDAILCNDDIKTATVFCYPLDKVTHRVRVSRKKHSPDQLIITFGKPNYAEQKYLALCKKAKCNPRRFWLKFKKK